MNKGVIHQIIGPVIDIKFNPEELPQLLNAINIVNDGKTIVAEVAQHKGDDVVRCIALSSTDGLKRGMEAVDTGAPISVPVGKEVLGRLFNVIGETIDEKGGSFCRNLLRNEGFYAILNKCVGLFFRSMRREFKYG